MALVVNDTRWRFAAKLPFLMLIQTAFFIVRGSGFLLMPVLSFTGFSVVCI